MRICESPEDCGFNDFCLTYFHEFIQILRWDSDDHALLCLGEPDFPRREPFVFQRNTFEVHFCTYLFPHLSDSGREPASPTIGDGAIQIPISCLQQSIHNLLFHNRVADLHHTAEAFRSIVQFCRRESRAMNSITPGLSADRNHQITGFNGFLAPVSRY